MRPTLRAVSVKMGEGIIGDIYFIDVTAEAVKSNLLTHILSVTRSATADLTHILSVTRSATPEGLRRCAISL